MIAELPASRSAGNERHRSRGLLFSTAFLALGLLSACAAPGQGQSASAGDETLAERVDRLERDLANLRIDYSVVRPAMERIVASEDGLEARLNAIESAFGPVTASIAPEAERAPAYTPPVNTPLPSVGIHLASYRDVENVERGWNELQESNSDLLAGLDLRIVDYRSAHDGLYKRLVAGPLDPAQAESRCESLKDRGVWCQVVGLDR